MCYERLTEVFFPPPRNSVRQCMWVLLAGDERTVSSTLFKGHVRCPLHFTSAHCVCRRPDSALAGRTDFSQDPLFALFKQARSEQLLPLSCRVLLKGSEFEETE